MRNILLGTTLLASIILPASLVRAQEPSAEILEAIGLTELRAANPGLSQGLDIKAHLVEAYTGNGDAYLPNPSNSLLSDNSINPIGTNPNATLSEIYAAHALDTAQHFFGSGGVAPDVGTNGVAINAYAATVKPVTSTDPSTPVANDNTPTTDWINGLVVNGGGDPNLSAFNQSTVSNHSYFIRESDDTPDLLRRLDHIIDQTDTTAVVGTSNTTSLPEAWAPAYNAITVGRSDGRHGAGTTTNYNAGRVAIDVVTPTTAVSTATPLVSGAVAILQDAARVDAGNISDASTSEVIRATILAGATKDSSEFERNTWSRTNTRPLDTTLGAGELNIFNSYNIQQGGEFDGSGTDPVSAINNNGWDYEAGINPNEQLLYEFEIGEGLEWEELSVALAWNMNIVDLAPSTLLFNPEEQLANLSLELFDSTDGFLGDLLDFSINSADVIDNVQHIYVPGTLEAGTYHLRVSNVENDSFATDYGLAWRATVVSAVPEPTAGTILLFVGLAGLARRRKS